MALTVCTQIIRNIQHIHNSTNKDKPPDRAIKLDRAKVVMTAGCISINLDTTKETISR